MGNHLCTESTTLNTRRTLWAVTLVTDTQEAVKSHLPSLHLLGECSRGAAAPGAEEGCDREVPLVQRRRHPSGWKVEGPRAPARRQPGWDCGT